MNPAKDDCNQNSAPIFPAKGIGTRVYTTRELFGGLNEIQIRHEKEMYVIRITRNGRLVMNK